MARMRDILSMTVCMKSFKLMAMKKIISAASVVAMMAVSCMKENVNNVGAVPQDGVFTAAFNDNVSTKAVLVPGEKSASVEWVAGDKVSIFAGQTNCLYTAQTSGAETTLKSEGTAATADTYYALYPYDSEATVAEGVITTTLPAEQTGVKGSFTTHLAVASTTGTSLSFSNVCGLVKVNVASDNVTKIEFKGNSGEAVAGSVSVPVSAEPAWTSVTAATSVIMVPAAGATFEQGDYYFAILPQTFAAGFTVTSYKNDGKAVVREVTSEVTINRSKIAVGKAFGISGQGTESSPYVIKTVQDMVDMKDLVSVAAPTYFELGANIDMAGVTYWEPVNNDRTVENVAEVHFDGKNFTISNFAPTEVAAGVGGDQASLFGILYGSCKNLTISADLNLAAFSTVGVICGFAGYEGRGELVTEFENVHVSGTVVGKKVVAGFAAGTNKSSYKNCSADVDVTASDNNVGGFVARGNGTGPNYFENCISTGDVTCTKTKGRFIGGFYGGDDAYTGQKLTFIKCAYTGNVTGDYQIAAFIGYTDLGTTEVTDCYATGDVIKVSNGTQGKQYGGIVGVNKGDMTITRCYYTGTLNSGKAESVGGILGLGASGNVTISNCISIGDFRSPTKSVGGIVGYTKGTTLTVDNCYVGGTLSAPENVGAIVGYAETSTTATNNRYSVTGAAAAVGTALDGMLTESGNSALAETEVSEYATASLVAKKLGWDETVWDLSGENPVLK